jgi:hypothetical protein
MSVTVAAITAVWRAWGAGLLRGRISRSDKVVFVIANVSFLISWSAFCVHLAKRWHYVPVDLRSDASGLALTFFVLWFYLVRERSSSLCLMLACLAFWTASQLALRMF